MLYSISGNTKSKSFYLSFSSGRYQHQLFLKPKEKISLILISVLECSVCRRIKLLQGHKPNPDNAQNYENFDKYVGGGGDMSNEKDMTRAFVCACWSVMYNLSTSQAVNFRIMKDGAFIRKTLFNKPIL